MKLRCVVVDDEKPARDKLRVLLANETELELVGEAAHAEEALTVISEQRPNVLFLDIQMPGKSGFDVLRAISPELLPCTIFTTAYDQYAVQAFTVRALDYLLKPFSRERLLEAVARAREHVQRHEQPGRPEVEELLASVPRSGPCLERLLVKTNERYIVVRADEIDWVEAAANYVILHTSGANHVLRKSLSAIEGELSPDVFYRSSRSALVNLTRVVEIQIVAPGEHAILLTTGARVPLTRGFRELQDKLQVMR